MKINSSKAKTISILFIFYIVLYIVLKLIIVLCQDLYMDNKIFNKKYGKEQTIKLESYNTEERSNTEYFSNKKGDYKIKIKNYFNGFEPGDSDNNYEYYIKYNSDYKDAEAAFMIGQFPTQLSNTNSNSLDSIYYEFNYFPLYISHMLRKSFLEKNNIKDDVDLIKYLRKREKKECTFLTPIIKIKEEYFFNFIESSYQTLEDVTYIDGDIRGYINRVDDSKQVCIVKDDKLYCLVFYKLDYFTDEIINDIIRSIIIEK